MLNVFPRPAAPSWMMKKSDKMVEPLDIPSRLQISGPGSAPQRGDQAAVTYAYIQIRD